MALTTEPLLKTKRDCSHPVIQQIHCEPSPNERQGAITMSEREQKALQIAAKSKLTRKGDTWLVPSQAGPKKYTVDPNPQSPSCTCPDFEARQLRCKHIFAVEIVIEREYTDDGETQTFTEKVTVRKTYKQAWPAYNK